MAKHSPLKKATHVATARFAPGPVTGVDREPGLIELARAAAADRCVSNVQFEVGDVHTLRFQDATFDVAFENALLEHVRDPVRPLRVLKPGGLAGIRDPDYGTVLRKGRVPCPRVL